MYTNGAIDKNVKDYLSPSTLKVSRLYLLPKLHKQGIPGRPIVSSCGSPTENIFRFVDYFLQPLTRALPSYVWGTTDFLHKLRELPVLSPESLLVTLDVSSLYTNIPHDEGINACEEFLNTRTDQSPPTKDLCQLIQLILKKGMLSFLTERIIYNNKELPWEPEWHRRTLTCSWESVSNSSCRPRAGCL